MKSMRGLVRFPRNSASNVVAFAYPKTQHQRTQTPAPYPNYRQYKPALRVEFHDRCVYCRAPAPIKGVDQFGADHYRPQRLFPELAAEYFNLYYCCNTCNRWKGSYWPAADVEATNFVPNPCEHVMFQHLHARPDGTVATKSRAGEITVQMLHLNDKLTVDWRLAASYTIEKLRGDEAQLLKKVIAVGKKRDLGQLSEGDAARAIELFNAELEKARTYLALYCEPPQA